MRGAETPERVAGSVQSDVQSRTLLGMLLQGGLSKLPELGDRAGRLSLYAGLLLVALPALRLPGDVGSVADPFLIFSFVCALCLAPAGRTLDLRVFKLHAIGVFLIITGVVISSVHAAQEWQSLINLTKFLVAATFMFFACAVLLHDRRQLRTAVGCYILSVVISSSAALLQVWFEASVPGYYGPGRMGGLFGNPNGLGTTAAVALAPALSLAARAAGPARVFWLVAVVVCVAGVMLSASRAGAVAAALALALWVLVHYRLNKEFTMLVAGSCLAAAALSGFLFAQWGGGAELSTRLERGLADPYADGAVASRLDQYEATLADAMEHPFVGVGLAENTVLGKGIHNLFLNVLHGGGLLALAGIIVILVDLFQKGLQTFSKAKTYGTKVVAMGMSVSVFAMVAAAMAGPVLYQREKWAPAALLFGLYALAWRRKRRNTVSHARSAPARGRRNSAQPAPRRRLLDSR